MHPVSSPHLLYVRRRRRPPPQRTGKITQPSDSSLSSQAAKIQRQAPPTPCPFCKSDANLQSTQKTRLRRKKDAPRRRQRFGRWWQVVGYDGPPYYQRCSEVFRDHLMRQTPNSAQCSREQPRDYCVRVLTGFTRSSDEELWARIDERNSKNKAKLEHSAKTKRSLPVTCTEPLRVGFESHPQYQTYIPNMYVPNVQSEDPSRAPAASWQRQPLQLKSETVYQIPSGSHAQVQVQTSGRKCLCTTSFAAKAAVFTVIGILAVLALIGLTYRSTVVEPARTDDENSEQSWANLLPSQPVPELPWHSLEPANREDVAISLNASHTWVMATPTN